MRRQTLELLIAVVAGVCGTGAALGACSSSSTGGGGTNPPGVDAASDSTKGKGGEGGACTPSSALAILFSPMYSAFVTDSTEQEFRIPAILTGAAAGSTITWSASDPTAVSFAHDVATGGTIITMASAPSSAVTITASIGSACATSPLTITSAVEADWAVGNARYNNNVPIVIGCIDSKVKAIIPADAGIKLPPAPDGGCPDAGPACTGCHGSNPTGGFFTGVQHTPEQTGGFSDQQLIEIITTGTVPEGGAFNPEIIPYAYWQAFHTWKDINTPELQKGIVVYLRSLTPEPNQGGLNFGSLRDAGLVSDSATP